MKDNLTPELRKKYRSAISKGYLLGYGPQWHRTFVGAFLTKYPQRSNIIEYLEHVVGHIPKWKDITDWNLQDFVIMLNDSMCLSSARTACSILKSIINANSGEIDIPSKNYAKILSLKKEPSQAVFLNEKEIQMIDAYVPENEKERCVKRIFMIEALTGARHSDAERLSIENIDKTSGELTYVPTKDTGCIIHLPIHNMLIKYLQEKTATTDLGTFNRVLREICRKCGIVDKIAIFRRGENTIGEKWEYVSSHTGRRSFATNLFLRDSSDISTIQKFMGQSDPKITMGYICGEKKPSSKIMNFFNRSNNMGKYILEKSKVNKDGYVLTDIENLVVIRFNENDFLGSKNVTCIGEKIEEEKMKDILSDAERYMSLFKAMEGYPQNCGLSFPEDFDFSDPSSDKNKLIFYCKKPTKIKIVVKANNFSSSDLIKSLENIIELLKKQKNI